MPVERYIRLTKIRNMQQSVLKDNGRYTAPELSGKKIKSLIIE